MSNFELGRRALLAAVAAFGLAGPAVSGGHQVLDSIHFLIPGGAGGGWDGTARGTGEALTEAGLVGTASYENMSGGGGGKAIGYLIENAESNHGTLMVNSTPIIIRSLTGVFPQNFRDLTLVAGTIGDYAAIVVGKDSPINSMADLIAAYDADPSGTAVGGGSVPGGMGPACRSGPYRTKGPRASTRSVCTACPLSSMPTMVHAGLLPWGCASRMLMSTTGCRLRNAPPPRFSQALMA